MGLAEGLSPRIPVGQLDGVPTIALPLENGTKDRRYPIGKIIVK